MNQEYDQLVKDIYAMLKRGEITEEEKKQRITAIARDMETRGMLPGSHGYEERVRAQAKAKENIVKRKCSACRVTKDRRKMVMVCRECYERHVRVE